MFAIDGSDIQIATNPNDSSSYFPGTNDQKDYNLLHLNALYNLDKHIYVDAIIQNRRDWNEHEAFVSMVDRSEIPKLSLSRIEDMSRITTWHISKKRDVIS
jgi:hypothetical protein